jgi:hypothetical protein
MKQPFVQKLICKMAGYSHGKPIGFPSSKTPQGMFNRYLFSGKETVKKISICLNTV